MLSYRKQAGLAALLLAFVGAGWMVFSTVGDAALDHGEISGVGSANERAGAPRPQLVTTADVTPAHTQESFRGIATARALSSVMLYPRSSGDVTEILVAPGERVEAGQVLLRLDDRDERLDLEQAQIDLDDARQTLWRYEQLLPSGAVSTSQVDGARIALSAARNRLERAELALERRSVTAPFAGVVGIAQISAGERVDPSTALLSLDDRSQLDIDFDVPERLAGLVEVGRAFQVSPAATPGRSYQAEVVAADSRLDVSTRSLRVRARVGNADDRLRPGMSFAVNLDLGGREQLAVPDMAVQWGRAGAYVWRVDEEGTVRQVPVTVLQRQVGQVVVEADLDASDRVVVEGVQRLRNGALVADAATPATSPEGGGEAVRQTAETGRSETAIR